MVAWEIVRDLRIFYNLYSGHLTVSKEGITDFEQISNAVPLCERLLYKSTCKK